MVKFRIRLKQIHDRTGLSPYAVWKKTGISQTTIRKYVTTDEVVQAYLPDIVVALANFYGVDWRDPSVVEIVEDDLPEIETPLSLMA